MFFITSPRKSGRERTDMMDLWANEIYQFSAFLDEMKRVTKKHQQPSQINSKTMNLVKLMNKKVIKNITTEAATVHFSCIPRMQCDDPFSELIKRFQAVCLTPQITKQRNLNNFKFAFEVRKRRSSFLSWCCKNSKRKK